MKRNKGVFFLFLKRGVGTSTTLTLSSCPGMVFLCIKVPIIPQRGSIFPSSLCRLLARQVWQPRLFPRLLVSWQSSTSQYELGVEFTFSRACDIQEGQRVCYKTLASDWGSSGFWLYNGALDVNCAQIPLPPPYVFPITLSNCCWRRPTWTSTLQSGPKVCSVTVLHLSHTLELSVF